MSSGIKDLINSIKSGQVDTVSPVTVETSPVTEKKKIVAKKDNAKPTTSAKKEKVEKKKDNINPVVVAKIVENEEKSVNFSNAFFAVLANKEFSFEQKSVSNIDDRLYEILMLIKRKKRVRNIALIINTIIEDYIERNKEQIKDLLVNNQL